MGGYGIEYHTRFRYLSVFSRQLMVHHASNVSRRMPAAGAVVNACSRLFVPLWMSAKHAIMQPIDELMIEVRERIAAKRSRQLAQGPHRFVTHCPGWALLRWTLGFLPIASGSALRLLRNGRYAA